MDTAKIFANIAAFKREAAIAKAAGCDLDTARSFERIEGLAAIATARRTGMDWTRYVPSKVGSCQSRVELEACERVEASARAALRWGIGAAEKKPEAKAYGTGEFRELWFQLKSEVPPAPEEGKIKPKPKVPDLTPA